VHAVTESGRCPVCAGSKLALHHDQGYRSLIRCRDCRLVFVDPLPSLDEKAEIESRGFDGKVLQEACEFFDDYDRNFEEDAVTRAFRRALERIGELHDPGRMLDVGPGTGIFLHLAREAGWEPHGIDITEQSAKKASEEFDLDIAVGNFEDYAFEEESFDCVTMLDVVEHSLDPVSFLRRGYDLLKPGGLLYVAVPNQGSLLNVLVDAYLHAGGPGKAFLLERLYVAPHLYYFDPRVMRYALETAGFEVVSVRGGHVALGRYRMSMWMRLPLEIILRAGALVGMSGRVNALARKPGSGV
jgi:SAM-dependent methyltransferase